MLFTGGKSSSFILNIIQVSTVFDSEPIGSFSLSRFVDICTRYFTSLSNVRDKIQRLTSETHLLGCFYMRENLFILCEIVFICAFLCEPSCLYVSIINTRMFVNFQLFVQGRVFVRSLHFGAHACDYICVSLCEQ